MPTYVYRFVKTGETIEVQQGFHDSTLTTIAHPRTGRRMAVKKVFTPVGVTFRGDGFYKTDSRAATAKGKRKGTDKAGSSDSTSTESKSDSTKPASAKSDSSANPKKSEATASSTP
jgi:predicted nucleic acid-binding Zn ribbon protein